jgi:hypothetical protein
MRVCKDPTTELDLTELISEIAVHSNAAQALNAAAGVGNVNRIKKLDNAVSLGSKSDDAAKIPAVGKLSKANALLLVNALLLLLQLLLQLLLLQLLLLVLRERQLRRQRLGLRRALGCLHYRHW